MEDIEDWSVVKVLEPKDPLISKGMRGTAKLLRAGGFLIAILEAGEGEGKRYAMGTVPKRRKDSVATVICGLSQDQFEKYVCEDD